jgi:hypothetical protein
MPSCLICEWCAKLHHRPSSNSNLPNSNFPFSVFSSSSSSPSLSRPRNTSTCSAGTMDHMPSVPQDLWVHTASQGTWHPAVVIISTSRLVKFFFSSFLILSDFAGQQGSHRPATSRHSNAKSPASELLCDATQATQVPPPCKHRSTSLCHVATPHHTMLHAARLPWMCKF